MRRFETVHKSDHHQLRAVLTNQEPLQPVVDKVLADLNAQCDLPPMQYSIDWKNMSSDTLAYTYTYYWPTTAAWIPANEFEVYFNPRVLWWNGSCIQQPRHHFDLYTAVMHEVLHGVGFLSTIDANKRSFPTNYDVLLKDAGGSKLVSSHGTFHGQFGQSVYIRNIKIFNPSAFLPGSSLSHVDSSSKLMSWAQTNCQQYLDYSTKLILNEIGIDCNVSSTRTGRTDSSSAFIGVGAAIFVVIAIIAGVMACKGNKGRKKRPLKEPLLT